jgi:dihydroorotase
LIDRVYFRALELELLKFKTERLNGPKVHVIGALTKGLKGLHLAELDALTEAGCQGFAQMEYDIVDTRTLYAALQYAKTLDTTLWLCVQDYFLSEKGVVHESTYTTRLGLVGIPRISEVIGLQRLLTLVENTQTSVHLTSICTKEGVELIRQAKQKGLNITADVCIHHLHLTDIDIGFYNPQMRFHPPLCEYADRQALLEGVLDGTIDMIVSDHTPTAEKNVPFGQAEIGASGVETLWSLIWKLYLDHQMNDEQLARLIDSVTIAPAKILKLSAEQVNQANFTVFAPDGYWEVKAENFVSQGKNSPWNHYELPATMIATIIDGEIKWCNKNK